MRSFLVLINQRPKIKKGQFARRVRCAEALSCFDSVLNVFHFKPKRIKRIIVPCQVCRQVMLKMQLNM